MKYVIVQMLCLWKRQKLAIGFIFDFESAGNWLYIGSDFDQMDLKFKSQAAKVNGSGNRPTWYMR